MNERKLQAWKISRSRLTVHELPPRCDALTLDVSSAHPDLGNKTGRNEITVRSKLAAQGVLF